MVGVGKAPKRRTHSGRREEVLEGRHQTAKRGIGQQRRVVVETSRQVLGALPVDGGDGVDHRFGQFSAGTAVSKEFPARCMTTVEKGPLLCGRKTSKVHYRRTLGHVGVPAWIVRTGLVAV